MNGVPGTTAIAAGVTMPDRVRSGWKRVHLIACNIVSSSLSTGETRSRLYTAVVAVAQDKCLAKTAREVSGKPYFAHHEIRVDLKECVEIRLSAVFGAPRIFLIKSAPSSDVKARLYHTVAPSFAGAGIMGLYSSAPGKVKFAFSLKDT